MVDPTLIIIVALIIIAAWILRDRPSKKTRRCEPEESEPGNEWEEPLVEKKLRALQQQYIEEVLQRPLDEIEANIKSIEEALDRPASVTEARIQRDNLDLLNTAYVIKLVNRE